MEKPAKSICPERLQLKLNSAVSILQARRTLQVQLLQELPMQHQIFAAYLKLRALNLPYSRQAQKLQECIKRVSRLTLLWKTLIPTDRAAT